MRSQNSSEISTSVDQQIVKVIFNSQNSSEISTSVDRLAPAGESGQLELLRNFYFGRSGGVQVVSVVARTPQKFLLRQISIQSVPPQAARTPQKFLLRQMEAYSRVMLFQLELLRNFYFGRSRFQVVRVFHSQNSSEISTSVDPKNSCLRSLSQNSSEISTSVDVHIVFSCFVLARTPQKFLLRQIFSGEGYMIEARTPQKFLLRQIL